MVDCGRLQITLGQIKTGRRDAGRRVVLPSASFGMRSRRSAGARSPVGVPPRHLRQRTNATAQLQKRSSWDVAKRRALPAPACPSPAAWPQTGHSAGRTFSRSRPGAKVTSPDPREPLPLRQPA